MTVSKKLLTAIAAFMTIVLIGGGCGSDSASGTKVIPTVQELLAKSKSSPGTAKILLNDLQRQATSSNCGVACLQSLLCYYLGSWDGGCRQDELGVALRVYDWIDSGKTGIKLTAHGYAHYTQIIKQAKEHGLEVEAKDDMTAADLRDAIEAGHPVMVVLQAWGTDANGDYTLTADDYAKMISEKIMDSGHWMAAIGYDENNFYFMDPSVSGNYTCISIEDFEKRWYDHTDEVMIDEKSYPAKDYNHFGLVFSYKAKPVFDRDVIARTY